MRKLLLFLILFGAGLALILWLDRDRGGPADDVEGPGFETGPGGGEPVDSDVTGQDIGQLRYEFSGRLEFRTLDADTGRKTLDFIATVRPDRDGEMVDYLADDLTVETYDPVTGELRRTLVAERAELALDFTAGPGQPVVADEGRIVLFGVTAVQRVGILFAPVTVKAAEAEAWLDREILKVPDDVEVDVRGEGFVGTGRGLDLDGSVRRIEIRENGNIRFVNRDGEEVEFNATEPGPLIIEEVGAAGEGALEASSERGGELVFAGEPPANLKARSMRLFGHAVDGSVSIEHATAVGEVRAVQGPDKYEGESARVELDGDGGLADLLLEDQPRADVVIEEEDGTEVPLVATGAGPLHVDLTGGMTRFDLVGPGRVEVPTRDLVATARGSIAGSTNELKDEGSFEAREQVRLTQGESTIETEYLDAFLLSGAEEAIDVECKGPTQMLAPQPDGSRVSVNAEVSITAEIRGDVWRVPLAVDALVVGVGDEPFRAKAGIVEDLDWIARTWVAEENVEWVTALGDGDATRMVSRGVEEGAVLYGEPGKPARFRAIPAPEPGVEASVQLAEFFALEIDVIGNQLEATDEVRAEVHTPDRFYRMTGDWAWFSVDEPVDDEPTRFELRGRDVREMLIREEGASTTVSCRTMEMSGTSTGNEVQVEDVTATDAVRVNYSGAFQMNGEGERFTLRERTKARLETTEGRLVRSWGRLPESGLPYEMTSTWMEYDGAVLVADHPHIFVNATLLPLTGEGEATGVTEVIADSMRADEKGLEFTGDVTIEGTDENGVPVFIESEHVRLGADFSGGLDLQVRSFEAQDGFRLRYGGLGVMSGDTIVSSPRRLVLRGEPAQLAVGDILIESTLIDIDIVNFLLACERGEIRSRGGPREWSLGFASLRPVVRGGDTMFVMATPVYVSPDAEMRANWASIWMHAERWRRRWEEELYGPAEEVTAVETAVEPAMPEEDLFQNIFRKLGEGSLSTYVRAIYMEGEFETVESGVRTSRADSVYLDLENTRGWFDGAELSYELKLGSRAQRVRTRSDRIVTAADGSLHAEKATLTTCDHDDPHYVIETGEFVLDPRPTGGWRFSARDNKLRFRAFQLPLPTIGNIVLDEGGDFVGVENEEGDITTVKNIAIGSSPRFGTAIGALFRYDIGSLGRKVGKLFGMKPDFVEGKWSFDGKYLSSRGPLVGVRLDLVERRPGKDPYWLNLYASGIPGDDGEDKGLVRVPEEDRDSFRGWYHARGRYPLDEKEWIDLAFTTQSDPGVQSEFFQREYVSYEERDNYLHWRKADDATYYDAKAKVRVDSYRTEVEELPSAGVYKGATKLFGVGPYDLLYSGSLDVDNLRRREGDLDYEEPFEDSFGDPDGLGDREVLRADARQRLELPIPTGIAGIRATPHVEARLTAWDEGVDSDDQPTRTALLGGIEVSTTIWKFDEDTTVRSFSPMASFKGDLYLEGNDGSPVRFDTVDDPLDGKELEVGFRSIRTKPGDIHRLDLELRGVRRYDRADGLPDLNLIAPLMRWRTEFFDVPCAFIHDARYDPNTGSTRYSISTVALRPNDRLVTQFSYKNGRGTDDEDRLFESASIDARYRISPKWEVEVGQSFSLLEDARLRTDLILRRFSHDFLLELQVQNRAGEGGTAFAIAINPLIGWSPPRLGILDTAYE